MSASSQAIGEDFNASVTGEAANFACTINYLLLFIVPSSKDSLAGMFYYNNTLYVGGHIPNVLLYHSFTFCGQNTLLLLLLI